MNTIEVIVLHYYDHPIYYPHMSQALYESLEKAFLNNEYKTMVPRHDFEDMLKQYFETLKN